MAQELGLPQANVKGRYVLRKEEMPGLILQTKNCTKAKKLFMKKIFSTMKELDKPATAETKTALTTDMANTKTILLRATVGQITSRTRN